VFFILGPVRCDTVCICTLYHCWRGTCQSFPLKAEGPERLKSLTGLRTAMFWVITQWVVLILCRSVGRTYRPHLQGHPLKVGPIGCTQTSARNYHHSLRNIPEEYSSHPLRGWSAKSHLGTVRCFSEQPELTPPRKPVPFTLHFVLFS